MGTTQARSLKMKAMPKMNGRSPLAPAGTKRNHGETATLPASGIGAQKREMLLEQSAYFRAEKRGFAPGNDWQDWFEAEQELLLTQTR